MTERFIPQHGGYEDLLSFQKARVIYDATVMMLRFGFAGAICKDATGQTIK